MSKVTKFLFGGALLSAGMASDVSSQQFVLSGTQSIFGYADTVVEVSGYDYYSVGTFGNRFIDGGIGDSYSYSFVNASGLASITSTQFSATADSNGNLGYADSSLVAQALGAVTVDQDATLALAWDFTQEGFEVFSVIRVVDESAGGIELFVTTGETAGTAFIPLFASTNYQITVRAAVGSIGPSSPPPPFSSFATATLIPAPASAALLGLGGLAAARRRR